MFFTDKENNLLQPFRKIFRAGNWLFHEGDKTKETFILLSGKINISKKDKTIVTLSAEGAVFGEMATILGEARTASALAKVDSTCVVLSRENLENCISSTPSVALKIMRTIATRLSITTAEYIGSLDKIEKLESEAEKNKHIREYEKLPVKTMKKQSTIQEIMAKFPLEELVQMLTVRVSAQMIGKYRNNFSKIQEEMAHFNKDCKLASLATEPINLDNLLSLAEKHEIRDQFEAKILENYKMVFSNMKM